MMSAFVIELVSQLHMHFPESNSPASISSRPNYEQTDCIWPRTTSSEHFKLKLTYAYEAFNRSSMQIKLHLKLVKNILKTVKSSAPIDNYFPFPLLTYLFEFPKFKRMITLKECWPTY